MRVCVVGSGGREHALADTLARSGEVVVSPGNPGTSGFAASPSERRPISNHPGPPEDVDADLFVVGPEAPLVDGLADRLRAKGRLVFGPGADGARLEGSKSWMKEVLAGVGVPTAPHATFDDLRGASEWLSRHEGPYVIKTDGLAAGKGVLVTPLLEEALADVEAKLSGRSFGGAGRTVVLEEALEGEELSLLAVCDGRAAVPLVPAQDFKRVFDGDAGPNTGGMGAYSPVPGASAEVVGRVMDTCVEPLVAALRARGIDYRGVLYAGLMITAEGPKIIEFNVRFADPETQVVLPRLTSDLACLLDEAASGRIRSEPAFGGGAGVTVVMASEGYPGAARTGDKISGVEDAAEWPGVTVFHAGTALDSSGQLVTAGGRVLDVTAVGEDLTEARDRAYRALAKVSFDGAHYRGDIAAGAAGKAPDATVQRARG